MDEKIINNIKSLAVEMISNTGSGHTGIVLSAAPILYTLYSRHMNIDPTNPEWIGRDRFVMSAGHGSALLYSILYFSGFDLTLDDLKGFRKFASKTPGHPEYGITPGVDMSTGPLGQGFASAVGMAIGEKILKEKYVLPNMGNVGEGNPIFDYNIYVLCSDGDLMEGISYEAASLAGNLNLDNLIVLYDSNNISLDGDTANTFTENVIGRFKASGWHTELVRNGNDVNAIDMAIKRAKDSSKPTLIEVKTIIGEGTEYAGTNDIHGKALTKEEVLKLKVNLDVNVEEFFVEESLIQVFRKSIYDRMKINLTDWNSNYEKYINLASEGKVEEILPNHPIDLLSFEFESDKKMALRDLNGIVLNKIASICPTFVGGSADLASSTKTYLKSGGDFKDGHYDGKNIWFGVREHAMGAILNGLALTKLKPFGSTFLTFSDYLKPSIRLAALMNLPVKYIFTHDSISIGEDGPTHQPVEHLVSLRAIPNLDVYRPADMNELIGSWHVALNRDNPSAFVLSKQEYESLDLTSKQLTSKGAYIIRKEERRLYGIIIATGSEVHMALKIAEELYLEKNIDIRVISMPCMEIFLKQNKEYYNDLLPIGYKVVVIEAASPLGWHRFVYSENYLITVNEFGISAKGEDVMDKLNFSYDKVKKKVENLLK